jgi:hypothetical protein
MASKTQGQNEKGKLGTGSFDARGGDLRACCERVAERLERVMDKTYLGDGVYAEYGEYNVVLTTENGISITNTIFIGPETLQALLDYLKFIGKVK